ncbi:hypothetical protein Dimus_036271 [Dionaea muscipula]
MKESKGGGFGFGFGFPFLLVLILGLSLFFSAVVAVPTSRSSNFLVQTPSIRDLCDQDMMDNKVCGRRITKEEGRTLLVDVNDYPGPGSNPVHDPPPT